MVATSVPGIRRQLVGWAAALVLGAAIGPVAALLAHQDRPVLSRTVALERVYRRGDPRAVRSLHEAAVGRTAPHPRTGGITYSLARLRWIQRAVDRGEPRYRYYLDPVKVTRRDLPKYGYTGRPIVVVSPSPPEPAPTAHHGEDGLPETDVVVRYRGREYWVVLNQFVRRGPRGIWSIITITRM